MTTDNSYVVELAQLALDRGAAFDVAYEADGTVRVSMHRRAPEVTQGVGSIHLDGAMTPEQSKALSDHLLRTMRDTQLRRR